jgi:hypothetical protein
MLQLTVKQIFEMSPPCLKDTKTNVSPIHPEYTYFTINVAVSEIEALKTTSISVLCLEIYTGR